METMHGFESAIPAIAALDTDNFFDVAERLADLLEEESEYLKTLKVDKIAALQEEKIALAEAFEKQFSLLAAQPHALKALSEDQAKEFAAIADDLSRVVEENYRRTASARAVNQRMMQVMMEVMSENLRPNTYTRAGQSGLGMDLVLSMNLNQKA